ncbi:MAG: DUF2461 domain-containing protein [Bacteroidales bacterium]
MRQVYDFLSRLRVNNNREWFEAHKSEYIEVQRYFNTFVEELIVEISKWDKEIDPNMLSVKDCTYRIYKDIRFSKDKLPYKTHMGAVICKGGKKSPYSVYYFHVEPKGGEDRKYLGDNLLFAGTYRPEPKIIQSIREEISLNGDSFINAIDRAKGFYITNDEVLKRTPKGYENINPQWQELLKHKGFSIAKRMDDDFFFAPNLAERVSVEFKKTYEFKQIMDRAIRYALEEM